MSTHVLGISALYHDSAACLVRDGRIVAAAQEERFTRLKHDASFPDHALRYCLAEAGIEASDLDAVAFYEKPWLKFERLLETYLATAPRGLRPYLMAMPVWLKEKLWIETAIRERLGFEDGPVYFPEHHQSHAASAFYASPFDEAAIVTFDAVGEWTTTSWGTGRGSAIELAQEIAFPHSLGLLYSAFTYYLGFRVNSGEYKVMGLAPYGEPRYVDAIYEHLVDLKEDGSFRLDQRYFDYLSGLTMTSGAFHELFGGPPRDPAEPLARRHMDLARSVPIVVEEAMMRIARHVRRESGMERLCMAGGVSLNCVANGKILREGLFDDLWIQPAAGDAGGALGAALFVWHQVMEEARTPAPAGRAGPADRQEGSYLGPAFDADRVADWLEARGIPHRRLAEDALLERTVELLEEEKVVGWLHGRMEFGPRALGHRSILGDARSPAMQSVLNMKIKGRESFRPFAPSCLADEAARYFDLEVDSPYMLLVAPVREERRRALDAADAAVEGVEAVKVTRSDIPAVTHVDYTARVQTVREETSPRYARLLERFRERTGYGLLVNTSFNVAGEPIVCTPAEAYRDFMETEMDVLVLEDCLLLKEEQEGRRDEAASGKEDPWAWPVPPAAPMTSAHLRKFGLVMATGFGLLTALFWWRGVGLMPWTGAVAGGFLAAGLVVPRLLAPVERGWMWMAEKLGAFMTRVLLTLTFVLGITPLALLARLVGRDRLDIRSPRAGDDATFWIEVEPDGPGSRPDEPY